MFSSSSSFLLIDGAESFFVQYVNIVETRVIVTFFGFDVIPQKPLELFGHIYYVGNLYLFLVDRH